VAETNTLVRGCTPCQHCSNVYRVNKNGQSVDESLPQRNVNN